MFLLGTTGTDLDFIFVDDFGVNPVATKYTFSFSLTLMYNYLTLFICLIQTEHKIVCVRVYVT